MCAAVVSALEGKDCREVMKSIAESSTIPQERLSYIVAGMYRVLSEAIRIPTLKQEVKWCKHWNVYVGKCTDKRLNQSVSVTRTYCDMSWQEKHSCI